MVAAHDKVPPLGYLHAWYLYEFWRWIMRRHPLNCAPTADDPVSLNH